jgi:hypothetical protein
VGPCSPPFNWGIAGTLGQWGNIARWRCRLAGGGSPLFLHFVDGEVGWLRKRLVVGNHYSGPLGDISTPSPYLSCEFPILVFLLIELIKL